MRILYTTHQFFPRHIGGTEVYTLGLATATRTAGHEVAVATYHETEASNTEDFIVSQIEHQQIPIYEFHYNLSVAPDPVRYEYQNAYIAGKFGEFVDQYQPDLVHVVHAMKLSGSILEVCAAKGIPFIVTICDYWFVCPRHTLLTWDGVRCQGPTEATSCVRCLHATHKFFNDPKSGDVDESVFTKVGKGISAHETTQVSHPELTALSERNSYLRSQVLKADRIVALSAFAKQILCANNYPADRIEVIPHGLELEPLPRTTRTESQAPHFMFIGSLVPFKGADLLIDALAMIPEVPLRLSIFGSLEPTRPYIDSLRKRAEADDRISFVGSFPTEKFPQILADGDVLLHPAQWYENAPLVLKAARRTGLTVFASDLGSIPAEVDTEQSMNRLLPPDDASLWAKAIAEFSRGPWREIVSSGVHVKTLQENAAELLDVYYSIVRNSASAPTIFDLSTDQSEWTHLVDHVSSAETSNRLGGFVNVQLVTLNRRSLSSIFQHPDSIIRFPAMRASNAVRFNFSIAIRQSSWERMGDPVLFEVHLIEAKLPPSVSKARVSQERTESAADPEKASRTKLYSKAVFPRENASERTWIDEQLTLPKIESGTFHLELSTTVIGSGNGSYCWAVWGDPKLMSPRTSIRRRLKRPERGHVFLITADALRQDVLGCYGSTEVRTPHIDEIAGDGATLLDAYTVSSTTPGAYASLLTGLYPPSHGVHAEWGKLPFDCPSLPADFTSQGYHSVMIASEDELDDPKLGLVHLFQRAVDSVGVPAQEGGITTRALLRNLSQITAPSFFWTQYFDVHPPSVPPDPYSTMYYQGDPTSAVNRSDWESVLRIHGVESIVDLESKLPWLEAGIVDEALVARLAATAHALKGLGGSKPDLAIHLLALGEHARLGLSPQSFAGWLDDQVALLNGGQVSADLISWLKLIREELQPVEDNILTWLSGVQDFRYAVSQYYGGVSFFDSQVGMLVSALKENDLYDQSTIIITSPHGEIFDELGLCFHHHALRESVLRIPLIIKLPAALGVPGGTRIGGGCEIIDIFPTLREALFGLSSPELPGRSLFEAIQNSHKVPERLRFALDAYGQMSAVTKGRYFFQRAEKAHRLSDQWQWKAGEFALFDLQSDPIANRDLAHQQPELVARLDSELTAWFIANPPLPLVPAPEFFSSLDDASPAPLTIDVSFVISNYNRLDLLKECLRTLQDSVRGVSYEIIVVDDCSTDGSREFLAAQDEPIRAILNHRRLGFAKNNNAAALLARGKHLCLLNNDLILTPNWLDPMLDCAKRFPSAGIVGNIQKRPVTETVDHIGVVFSAGGEPANYGSSVQILPKRRYSEWPVVTAACCLILREVFFELRGFDEGFRNGFEDVDLCLRLRNSGYRNFVANRSVIYHHLHGSPGRFQRESENLNRLRSRWGYEGKLLSKLTPPETYQQDRNNLLSSLTNPWRHHPMQIASSLGRYLRFEAKKILYRLFFAYPHLFPPKLQRRLGSA